ncbi:hypothetical protein Tco_1172122, partial [Tanacetum coccineum]
CGTSERTSELELEILAMKLGCALEKQLVLEMIVDESLDMIEDESLDMIVDELLMVKDKSLEKLVDETLKLDEEDFESMIADCKLSHSC